LSLRGRLTFRSLRLSVLVEGKGEARLREVRRPGYHHFVLVNSDVVFRREGLKKIGMGGEKGGRVEGWERLASRRKQRCWWIEVRWSLILPFLLSRLSRRGFLILRVFGHLKHHTSHSRSSSQAVSHPPMYTPLSLPCIHVSIGVERAVDGGEVRKDPSLVKRFVCAVQGGVYIEGEGIEDDDEG
jgi:hypothetical protein